MVVTITKFFIHSLYMPSNLSAADSLQDCILCPVGTFNADSGSSGIESCLPCTEEQISLDFCPSGSILPSYRVSVSTIYCISFLVVQYFSGQVCICVQYPVWL